MHPLVALLVLLSEKVLHGEDCAFSLVATKLFYFAASFLIWKEKVFPECVSYCSLLLLVRHLGQLVLSLSV